MKNFCKNRLVWPILAERIGDRTGSNSVQPCLCSPVFASNNKTSRIILLRKQECVCSIWTPRFVIHSSETALFQSMKFVSATTLDCQYPIFIWIGILNYFALPFLLNSSISHQFTTYYRFLTWRYVVMSTTMRPKIKMKSAGMSQISRSSGLIPV